MSDQIEIAKKELEEKEKKLIKMEMDLKKISDMLDFKIGVIDSEGIFGELIKAIDRVYVLYVAEKGNDNRIIEFVTNVVGARKELVNAERRS